MKTPIVSLDAHCGVQAYVAPGLGLQDAGHVVPDLGIGLPDTNLRAI